ncbi:outer membrane protein assembly factor [Oryzomonas japonica]|uniref:Translocation and assembly module subunit TamA n=1 Tax=Oryzomonas japonica TaxID=2603858 RepID=A0A7J4ZM93_9BACT|nr:autotransporter assembly complex family protein [Oryzomonas japonica]KAB0663786.1 outer membrane protein assembly factor [Oryzomonas japonica]
MPDFTSRYAHNYAVLHLGAAQTVLAFLVLWLCLALPLHAAEPVEIVVTGVEGAALKNVQETLALPAGLVREGTVDRIWLDRFARQAGDKTRTALEPFGYYHALVTVTVEPDGGERYRLLVTVAPGEPVRLTGVTVTMVGPGKEEKRLARLVTAFPLHKGDVLLHQKYEEAKTALTSRARDLGYLDAEFSRHEIRVAPSATTATIELVLDTGEKYYFGETRIQGAPDYPDRFLRRHLTYAPGEVFSYPHLGETQRNFTNSERFKEVVITPEKQDAEAHRVPIAVQLTPGPRISVRPGIGYGTDTGARFTVRYRDLNMFHQGHELYSQLYVAERLQGVVTGYVLPSPKDVRSSTTLQLNLQQENITTYFSRIAALELDRNRSFGTGKLGTAYIKAQYEDYTVGAQKSFARLLLPGLRFSDDRYDNPVRPRRGFRYTLDLHGTHQLLGSDTKLVQILAAGSYLLPLPWRLSLHMRANAGATLLNDPLTDIPPSLRFFTGGDQSVRGYSYKSLGPRDATGKVVGGKQLLTSSIELERALFKDWGVSLFYDAGNAFNNFSAIKLFQGAGVGLHYYTSIGALNLSVAQPLGVDKQALHFHFTVGFEL